MTQRCILSSARQVRACGLDLDDFGRVKNWPEASAMRWAGSRTGAWCLRQQRARLEDRYVVDTNVLIAASAAVRLILKYRCHLLIQRCECGYGNGDTFSPVPRGWCWIWLAG
jgi:hypothetical protein